MIKLSIIALALSGVFAANDIQNNSINALLKDMEEKIQETERNVNLNAEAIRAALHEKKIETTLPEVQIPSISEEKEEFPEVKTLQEALVNEETSVQHSSFADESTTEVTQDTVVENKEAATKKEGEETPSSQQPTNWSFLNLFRTNNKGVETKPVDVKPPPQPATIPKKPETEAQSGYFSWFSRKPVKQQVVPILPENTEVSQTEFNTESVTETETATHFPSEESQVTAEEITLDLPSESQTAFEEASVTEDVDFGPEGPAPLFSAEEDNGPTHPIQ
jgi:hypothetical protein